MLLVLQPQPISPISTSRLNLLNRLKLPQISPVPKATIPQISPVKLEEKSNQTTPEQIPAAPKLDTFEERKRKFLEEMQRTPIEPLRKPRGRKTSIIQTSSLLKNYRKIGITPRPIEKNLLNQNEEKIEQKKSKRIKQESNKNGDMEIEIPIKHIISQEEIEDPDDENNEISVPIRPKNIIFKEDIQDSLSNMLIPYF